MHVWRGGGGLGCEPDVTVDYGMCDMIFHHGLQLLRVTERTVCPECKLSKDRNVNGW